MWIVAAQIVLFLAVAAGLGFLVAWMLRTLLPPRWLVQRLDETQARVVALSAELDQTNASLAHLTARSARDQPVAPAAIAGLLSPAAAAHSSLDASHFQEIPRFLNEPKLGPARPPFNGDLFAEPSMTREAKPTHATPYGEAHGEAGDPVLRSEAGDPVIQGEAQGAAGYPEVHGEAGALPFSAQRARAGDDLKLIRGVGPRFERLLNELGVLTFRQIAQWDESDIQRIATHVKTFPDRIRRDGWIASAKQQHLIKYGERL